MQLLQKKLNNLIYFVNKYLKLYCQLSTSLGERPDPSEFDCVFDYMKEAGIVPEKHIMFTDGYPWGSWGDENYCDTLFIVHGSGYGDKTPEAPFGITVPYDRKSD